MAAALFFLPYQTATVAGIAQPGAKLFFYTAGTTTPLTVYTNSALTIAATNPVVANGAGRFPDTYLDATKTYRLVIKSKAGTTLDDIDPYIPGTAPDAGSLSPYSTAAAASAAAASASAISAANDAGAAAGYLTALATAPTSGMSLTAASRSALALLDTSRAVILQEAGREGTFVYSSSNLSTLVTADTNQGIFVAPASDTTGASGAWVRKFDGSANALWFIGTDPTASGTGAKLVTALNTLNAIRTASTATFKPLIPLYCPSSAGQYAMGSTTFPSSYPFHIYGDHTASGDSSHGTVFKWTGDVTAFNLLGYTGSLYNTNGSSIHNLYLSGPNPLASGAGLTSHAIYLNSISNIYDIYVDGFSGDAVNVYANVSANNGNVNGSVLRNIRSSNCRWNIRLNGPDTNAITIIHPYGISNHLGNVHDNSFLGCATYGGMAESCGPSAILPSRCSYGGNIYVTLFGADWETINKAWCSTNAPSGTTASNQGWGYLQAGGPSATAPAWTSGLTWHFSASIAITSAPGMGTATGMYIEPGMNPAIMQGNITFQPAHHTGLVWGSTGGSGNWLRSRNGFYTVNDFSCTSVTSTGTGASSFAGNLTVTGGLKSLLSGGTLYGSLLATGSGVTLEAYESGSASYYPLAINASYIDFMYNAVTRIFRADSTGLRLYSGSLGYNAGTGGTVTQATNKSTGVTLNKACGQITMNAAALAAGAKVSFVVTNSQVAATDAIIVGISGGGTANAYRATFTAVAAGSFTITVENIAGGPLSEAPVINFSVIKAVAA